MGQDLLQDQIIQAIEEENFLDAFDMLNNYLELYGKDEFYYLALSDVLLNTDNFKETIELVNIAMDDGYVNDLFYERMGDAYYQMEEYTDALEWFLKCDMHEDNPNLLHMIYMCGLCHFQLEEYDKAISYFEDVLLEQESIEAYYNCATAYLKCGNKKRALEYYHKIHEDKEVLTNICLELIDVEAFDEAKQFFVQLNMKDYLFEVWIGHHYESQENYQKACEYMEIALDKSNADLVKFDLVTYYLKLNKKEKCLSLSQEILDNDEIHDENVYQFVQAHLNNLDFFVDKKVKIDQLNRLEKYTKETPALYILLLETAIKHRLTNKQDEYIKELELLSFDDETMTHLVCQALVEAYIYKERYEDALNLLEEDYTMFDKFYYKYKFICLVELNQMDEALKLYDHVMPDGRCAIMLMQIYANREDNDGFMRVVMDMKDTHPEDIEEFDFFIDSLEDTLKKYGKL